MAGVSAATLAERFERLDILEGVRQAVEDNADKLAEYNRDQLLEGTDSEGKKMAKYASQAYSRKKYALNNRAGFGTRDQKLTGKFHQSIKVRAGYRAATFEANSDTAKYVFERDGEGKVLGLSEKYVSEFRRAVLRDYLLSYVQKQITG